MLLINDVWQSLYTRYVIHCDIEDSKACKSHVSLQNGTRVQIQASTRHKHKCMTVFNIAHETREDQAKWNVLR